MFKTAVPEDHSPIWGVIAGCVAFVLLLSGGYFLIS